MEKRKKWKMRIQRFMKRPTEPYDDEYAAARDWHDHIGHVNGVDYSPIKEYANKKYGELCAVHDTIDKKAEWLFGIAIAAFGAVLTGVETWSLSIGWALPCLTLLLLSMSLALRAKLPGPRPSGVTIREAVRVREQDDHWAVRMIASTHCAATGLRKLTEWKTGHIKVASIFIVVAALLFILPLGLSRTPVVSEDRHEVAESREDRHSYSESSQLDSGAQSEGRQVPSAVK